MIPYYSPHFSGVDLLRTLVYGNPFSKLEDMFRELTGKRYVLVTSSCRAALFLAYKSLRARGLVHVSPLTCQIALLPIAEAGNKIMFHDVEKNDWTIDPAKVEQGISNDSLAIQAIHLGGFPCDLPALRKIANDRGLVLVEDCAQGFGASLAGKSVGHWGDISCFTLTKNVFGLGGGILATNNQEYYTRARELQASWRKESKVKIANRVLNALLSSDRDNILIEKAYQRLNKVKKNYISQTGETSLSALERQLMLPSRTYPASVAAREKKISCLVCQRSSQVLRIRKVLEPLGFVFQSNEQAVPSYPKLFCYHLEVDSRKYIAALNSSGLEAMHLEHKQAVFYQPKMTLMMDCEISGELPNYELIHDSLVSFPLYEDLHTRDVAKMSLIAKRNLP